MTHDGAFHHEPPDSDTRTDEQYERLQTESERTGLGLAELARRPVQRDPHPVVATVVLGSV